MTDQITAPEPEPAPAKRKGSNLVVRLDPELKKAAQKRAKERGWRLSSVMRALLRAWIDEDMISAADVGAEDRQVSTHKRKRRKKKKRTQ